jgi:hypothetical protein
LTFATDPDLKLLGQVLDRLIQLRNQADYQLAGPGPFTSSQIAVQAVNKARDAIALLDQIEGDALRRTAAISSIRP